MRGDRTADSAPAPATVPPGVYPPREDTFLLLPFAAVPPHRRVLEIGTGAGWVALAAARAGARVVATDRNPAALRGLRTAARAESLDLEVVRTDLARGLGRFDRVLSNPPYLPTRPEDRDPDPWVNLALDGGPDGTEVLDRVLAELPHHLADGGEAFVVVSSLLPEPRRTELADRWRADGGTISVAAVRSLEGERLEVWRLARHDGPGSAR